MQQICQKFRISCNQGSVAHQTKMRHRIRCTIRWRMGPRAPQNSALFCGAFWSGAPQNTLILWRIRRCATEYQYQSHRFCGASHMRHRIKIRCATDDLFPGSDM